METKMEKKTKHLSRIGRTGAAAIILLGMSGATVSATESTPQSRGLLAVVDPPNLGQFIKNKSAAIKLGKALFWDMQAGSDGVVSCATCHHQAFADHRTKNQLNPGPNGRFDLGGGKPNYALKASDFPLRSDDVVGSQGVVKANFVDIVPGKSEDLRTLVPDPVFNINGVNIRQTTGKNAPTSEDAALNHRNFWNGRANQVFNGATPFGADDPAAQGKILMVHSDGSVTPTVINITPGAAASQAVGPANNNVEMAYAGRPFAKVGKKLLNLTPLGKQKVHVNDSLLGALSKSPNPGLSATYKQLIEDAFDPAWWNSNNVYTLDASGKPALKGTGTPVGTNEFDLMEINFSLIWGLSIQLYEGTLMASETPMDHFLNGVADAKFGPLEQQGLKIFNDPKTGRCFQCHVGAQLTAASLENVTARGTSQLRTLRDGAQAFFDTGFANIGVRPTREDFIAGGTTPFGTPLNFSRALHPGERMAVDGAAKVPGLRNVDLTGPYFHTGSKGTLENVLDFYHQRGDFRMSNRDNIDQQFEQIRIGGSEQKALAAFLRNGLTDDRARFEKAPFDHPELFVPNGHLANGADDMVRLPQIGANGRAPEGLSALKPFLQ
jgi:cytochrome c peroxidase